MEISRGLDKSAALVLSYISPRNTSTLTKPIWAEDLTSNNVGGFKALFFLLQFALEKNIVHLQVFGYSALTVGLKGG